MPFQSTVRSRQANGFAGQVLLDVPSVVRVFRLTAQVVKANPMGYAYTYAGEVAGVQGLQSVQQAQVGLFGAGAPFVGLMCHPEQQALSGTASGTLSPSLDVGANEVAQFILKGACVVNFSTAVNYGDDVYFDDATGALFNAAAAGRTLIVGAEVTNTIAAAGLTTVFLG